MKKSIYTRPDKPRYVCGAVSVEVPQIGDIKPVVPLIVDRATECHVTPSEVAERMVGYLSDCERILEPSAGTGNIAQAAIDAGLEVVAVERNFSLCHHLRGIVPDAISADFLEWETSERFAGIVMNPPFSQVRKHIEKALSLLADSGEIIALVPVTYQKGEELERLPCDTFANAKVYTKIVRLTNEVTA